jgi:multiple sugar transport system permease protein
MSAPAVPVAHRRGHAWHPARRVLLYALLVLLTLAFVLPLLWMVITSLKTDAEATLAPPTVIPHDGTSEAYRQILDSGGRFPVIRWFVNSVIAGVANSLLVVATAAPAAYALARLEFRGKRAAYALIVATLFIPPIIFLAPNYLIVDRLGWLDTLLAVIVPPAASAFGVFFLRQFFLGIPVELEEAARLDGASRWRIFRSIIVPLSKPALITLAMLTLLTNWNDFLWPVYVLFNPDHLTLGPGLLLLQSAQTTHYPLIMAGGVLACIPILAVFVFAQRFIIEGIGRTGIKG